MTPTKHIDKPIAKFAETPIDTQPRWWAVRSRVTGEFFSPSGSGASIYWDEEDAHAMAGIANTTAIGKLWAVEPLPATPPAVCQGKAPVHKRTVATQVMWAVGHPECQSAVLVTITEPSAKQLAQIGLPLDVDAEPLLRNTARRIEQHLTDAGGNSRVLFTREVQHGFL